MKKFAAILLMGTTVFSTCGYYFPYSELQYEYDDKTGTCIIYRAFSLQGRIIERTVIEQRKTLKSTCQLPTFGAWP
mgnify:CR=1 FL=1